ncbi:ANTH-domain-containing protein, partial [Piedraia hortae CBS 480.64]
MASSIEKSVKGATKVKLAAPKAKYIDNILGATHAGEAAVGEVFRSLTRRMRDSTWTVAFKSLVVVHVMIREGAPDVTLRFIADAPQTRLAINGYTDVQTQGMNIRHYSDYLLTRANAYSTCHVDHVLQGAERFKRLGIEKGLLKEAQVVQTEIHALVQCDFLTNEVENDISLTAFRLLTRDLLDLYKVLNEAVMVLLTMYFELSRSNAERVVAIYKEFCRLTDHVMRYLSVARQYEHAMRLKVPQLRHAPTSLATSLQDYLDDKDFEMNRRQYLAKQQALKGNKNGKSGLRESPKPKEKEKSAPAESTPLPAIAPPPAKGPAPDLIDLFESIEQNQQPMVQSPPMQPQMNGFPQQQQLSPPQQYAFYQNPNPFGMQQPQMTGYQMPPPQQPFPPNNYTPQRPQSSFHQSPPQLFPPQQPLQPQLTGTTNPFRRSMMLSSTPLSQPEQPQNTNPFARNSQMLRPQTTGTNPFAKTQPQEQLIPMQPQPTGTNPFRQSAFIGTQGTGWQNAPQPTMGGLEQLPTVAVFPRQGQ